MTVKEFSTKLNSLVKYALSVANSNRGKLEVFLEGLGFDIAKDITMEDNLPRSFFKALRFDTMR